MEEEHSGNTFPSTYELFGMLSKKVMDGKLEVACVAIVVTMDTLPQQ